MKYRKTLTILAFIVIAGSFAASLVGVLPGKTVLPGGDREVTSVHGDVYKYYGRGIYARETVSYAVQAKAQDWVTLLVGIPLLAAGIILARKDSFRGRLLLTGIFGYFLYTYISYSFLISFNRLFLLYVTLFAASLYGFILSYIEIYRGDIKERFSDRFPRRALGIFFIVIGAILLLLWMGRIAPAMVGNTPPYGLEIYTTLVIQAMDLALIVPAAFLSGIALLRKSAVGYGLAAVISVKGIAMFTAVGLMALFMSRSGVEVSPVELIIFPGAALINLFFAFLLFRSVRSS